MQIHPIVQECLTRGLELKVKMENNEIRYYFEDGFYKSGSSTYLVASNSTDHMVLHTRYENQEEVTSFEDIVNASYEWWCSSKHRCDGWNQPHAGWAEFYVEFGLVTKQTVTTTVYS